eukprot:363793-Chlamydomonas_euryale.AAC.8
MLGGTRAWAVCAKSRHTVRGGRLPAARSKARLVCLRAHAGCMRTGLCSVLRLHRPEIPKAMLPTSPPCLQARSSICAYICPSATMHAIAAAGRCKGGGEAGAARAHPGAGAGSGSCTGGLGIGAGGSGWCWW